MVSRATMTPCGLPRHTATSSADPRSVRRKVGVLTPTFLHRIGVSRRTGGSTVRVALLSYRSKPHCGGQGVYVRHLSRELVALGHTVEVFSGQPYPDLDPGVVLTKVPSLDLYREPDPFRTPALNEFRDGIDVLEVAVMYTAGFPAPLTSTSSTTTRRWATVCCGCLGPSCPWCRRSTTRSPSTDEPSLPPRRRGSVGSACAVGMAS